MVGSVRAVAEESRPLQVSATVRRHLGVRAAATLPALELVEADLKHGYVDIPAPLALEIVTNSPDAQQLQLSVDEPSVRSVRLRSDSNVAPSAEALVVPVPAGRGMRRLELRLWLRIYLSATAAPGAYRWPVRVSVLSQ